MKRLFGGGKSKGKKKARPPPSDSDASSFTQSSGDHPPLPIPNPSILNGHPAEDTHGYEHPDDHTPESSVDHADALLQYPPPHMTQTTPPEPKRPKWRLWHSKPPPGAPIPKTESSVSSNSSMYDDHHHVSTGHMRAPPGGSRGGPPSVAAGSHYDQTRGYASMDTHHPQIMDPVPTKPKKKFVLFNLNWKPKKRETNTMPSYLQPIPLARSASEPSRPGTMIDQEDYFPPTTPMPDMDDVVPVARTPSHITRESLVGRSSLEPPGMAPTPPVSRKPTIKRAAGLARLLSFKKKRPPSPIPETPLTRTQSLPPSRPGTLVEPESPTGAGVYRQPSAASRIPPSEHRTVMEYPAQPGGSLHRANTQTSVRTRAMPIPHHQAGGLSRTPTTTDHQKSGPPTQATVSRHQSTRRRDPSPPPRDRAIPQPSKTRPTYSHPPYTHLRLNANPSKEKFRLWHHANQPLIAHACRLVADAPLVDFVHSLCTGNKKAVCIGINYEGTKYPLKGCINDAEHAREYLIRYHGFHSHNVAMLTDTGKNKPTRAMLMGAFKWLVEGAQPHDSLVLHYSGHGGQARDLRGDESDGWDEVIYPLDYKDNGYIDDDTLHKMLVDPLPAGCRLTAIFDSCHSGTVLDLPFIYSSSCRQRSSHISNRSRRRQQTAADVLSLSACKDGETSADTFQGGVPVGAMSWALLSALKRNKDLTYKQLLARLRDILEPRYEQRPQLGSSHPIDPNRKFLL